MACSAAVQQFQKLLDMHGGPAEARRWAELKGRLCIHEQQAQQQQQQGQAAAGSGGEAPGAGAGERAGAGPLDLQLTPIPGRIARLEKVTVQQRAVFGLGDALRVLTLTANGNAVRCAERQGVNLEVVMHRAVWLAGI